MMKKEEAIAELLSQAEAVRHHTITKIKVRRQYRERHNDVSIDILLASAKRDFLTERNILKTVKKRIEDRFGESVGHIKDQDGRLS
jgi:hypothetical protein